MPTTTTTKRNKRTFTPLSATHISGTTISIDDSPAPAKPTAALSSSDDSAAPEPSTDQIKAEVGALVESWNHALPQPREIKISDTFKSLIAPLTEEERAQLEANLLKDGCRDPLVLWRGVLIDGHHRREICERHGIPFETKEMEFADEEAAADWIDANQLGRRNLSPDAMSFLRGRRYNRTKRQDGGHGDQRSGGKSCTPNSAEVIAAQHGVSERTIKNDGALAAAVEKIAPVVPDITTRVMAGNIPSRQAVVEAAKDLKTAPEKLSTPRTSKQGTAKQRPNSDPKRPVNSRPCQGTSWNRSMVTSLSWSVSARSQLSQITDTDSQAIEAFEAVIDYCEKRLVTIRQQKAS